MYELVLQRRAILLLLTSFSIAVGITLTALGEELGHGLLIAGALSIPLATAMLVSIPVVWSKVTRLGQELRWWHLLWALFFLSGLTFRVRETEALVENPLDPAALFRISLVSVVGLILLGALTLNHRLTLSRVFGGLIGLLAFYPLVGIASTLWSVYPAWTLYKSVEYLVGVALIGTIVANVKSEAEFKSLFDWMWLLVGLMALSVGLGVVLWPDKAVSHGVGLLGIQIRGIFPRVAANSVGGLGALLGIVAMVRLLFAKGSSRRFYVVVFLMGMVMLVLSQSRSPLLGFLLAAPLVLFVAGRIGVVALVTFSVVPALYFTSLGDYFWEFFKRGQPDELFWTFTGRLIWWEIALREWFPNSPIIGYGAYAGGRFVVLSNVEVGLKVNLHNTWMEALLGTGIVGALPLIAAVILTWRSLIVFRSNEKLCFIRQLRAESIGVLVLLTVRSIFSVAFIWQPLNTWLLIIGFAEFIRKQRC